MPIRPRSGRSRSRPRRRWARPTSKRPDFAARRPRLRATFDEAPELYERARPRYPGGLFDDLVALAELPAGSRILEIGPGTGQATRPLAERGLHVVCVELGQHLAAAARQLLGDLPNVEIVHADFETWEPRGGPFDAVVAFNSFHWLDPEVKYRLAAAALREAGVLAVVAVRHVLPADGDPFFADVQKDYVELRATSTWDLGPPPPPDAVAGRAEQIDASGVFRTVASRRHLWDVTYSADEYLAMLSTTSEHRVLDPVLRDELYERIRRRVDRAGRRVRKTYLATLDIARRV